MPLKHRTETLLVVILAAVMLLTGLILASLPALPMGIIPWCIVCVATCIYPLVLYPLFKTDRADYEFRTLHWVPTGLTVLWLLLQLLTKIWPSASVLSSAFTWAWALPITSVAVLALIVFCLKVLRQWSKRIALMGLLYIPFACLAAWSAAGANIEQQVGNLLWNNSIYHSIHTYIAKVSPMPVETNTSASSAAIHTSSSILSNVDAASLTPEEKKWRSFLFDYQKYSSIASQSIGSIKNQPIVTSSKKSEVSSIIIGQTSSKPNELPHSGREYAYIALTLIAFYCSTLHKKYRLTA